MKKTCVYLITIANGKQYVGVATNLKRRLKEHSARDSMVGRAIRKHGIASVDVIAECDSFEAALEREQAEVESRGTLHPHGLNMTVGGYGSGGFPTPQHVIDARSALMHAYNAATSAEEKEANWRKGIEASRNTPWTAERKEKHAARMREQHAARRERGEPSRMQAAVQASANAWSDERRKNISNAKKGKPWSEAQRAVHTRRREKGVTIGSGLSNVPDLTGA